jgi:DNA-binding beta-propeller fold protein YncE
MRFITNNGKNNWKVLLIIFVLSIISGGGIFWFSAEFLNEPVIFETVNLKIDHRTNTASAATSTGSSAISAIPTIKKSPRASDLPGQIITHLFDIAYIAAPKGIAFSPDGSQIWITKLLNQKSGAAVLNSKTGEKIIDINLNNAGGVESIFSTDGKRVYISQMETAKIFEIDASTKEILRIFDTKSTWTKIITLSIDGKKLYASNWVGNNVSEFDLESGTILRNIPTVKTPRSIYPTKDGNYLYVAGFDKGEIQKINLKTGTSTVVYKSGGAMRHFAVDEKRGIIFVSDMAKGVIFQLSLADDSVVKFVDTDTNPNTIVLSPDNKILFVSCRGENYSAINYSEPGPEWGSVLVFDTRSGKMLDAIVGGNQPTALAISPDGKLLVFSNFLDGTLEFFKVPSYESILAGNGGSSGIYKNYLKK